MSSWRLIAYTYLTTKLKHWQVGRTITMVLINHITHWKETITIEKLYTTAAMVSGILSVCTLVFMTGSTYNPLMRWATVVTGNANIHCHRRTDLTNYSAMSSSSASGRGMAAASCNCFSYSCCCCWSICTSGGARATCSTKCRLGSPTSLRARYRKGFS